MLDLSKTRENIDSVDKQIVALFEERMTLAKEVAEYKRETGKPVLDREREQKKLQALTLLATNEYNKYPIEELFTQIMSISRKYQYSLLSSCGDDLSFERKDKLPINNTTSVIFFGETGSHTEQAMKDYFGTSIKSYSASTFKAVMDAVHNKEADYGVLPIENSSTGGIQDIYDLLTGYDNYIVGEHILKIEQVLVGLAGSSIGSLKKVYSHPQGLLQCASFFDANPNVKAVPYHSTSASAKKIVEDNDYESAAIASKSAAHYYGLTILKENLNYENTNSTRFIVIAQDRLYLSNANKVSICFELPHESGSLYNMLSHFIYNNLNMTKIESRPIKGRPWEYRFFVDFEGNLTDSGVKNAILGIQEEAVSLKILGNFLTV